MQYLLLDSASLIELHKYAHPFSLLCIGFSWIGRCEIASFPIFFPPSFEKQDVFPFFALAFPARVCTFFLSIPGCSTSFRCTCENWPTPFAVPIPFRNVRDFLVVPLFFPHFHFFFVGTPSSVQVAIFRGIVNSFSAPVMVT